MKKLFCFTLAVLCLLFAFRQPVQALVTPAEKESSINISGYEAYRRVNYKTTVTFSADFENSPQGAEIHWLIDGERDEKTDMLTVESPKDTYTVQAKLVSQGREICASRVETVIVGNGFFDRVGWFFRHFFRPGDYVTEQKKNDTIKIGTKELTIDAGAQGEFEILVASDIHITECDGRDSKELNKLSVKRSETYPESKVYLEEFIDAQRKSGDELFILGDMTDFISQANLDYIRAATKGCKLTFLAGNHDYRSMGGTEYDVPQSREKNFDKINALYPNDISFFSKVINGVNFVGIDDVYYRFTADQLEKLKAEVGKGLPIVLLVHVPLYENSMFNAITGPDRAYASLVNVPENLLAGYPEKRLIQQAPDEPTKAMYDYITSSPAIKAVLCGHLHKNFAVTLQGGIPQYAVARGEMLKITVK